MENETLVLKKNLTQNQAILVGLFAIRPPPLTVPENLRSNTIVDQL